MKIDKEGYVCRKTTYHNGGTPEKDWQFRNWWLVRYNSSGLKGCVPLAYVSLPLHLIGKKVRFKLEVIEDE